MIRLGLAAESAGDAALVRALVDRCVLDGVDWFDAATLEASRSWTGLGEEPWFDLHRTKDVAKGLNLRLWGRFDGEAGNADALMARKVLFLFVAAGVDALVVARDCDRQPERALGWHQALSTHRAKQNSTTSGPEMGVALGLAQPEIEAWSVAVWDPMTDAERAAHATVRKRIGFDPVKRASGLSSARQTQKRDAKTVLDELCAHRPDPRAHLHDAPLERLRAADPDCGLPAFLAQVDAHIRPLFDGSPPA